MLLLILLGGLVGTVNAQSRPLYDLPGANVRVFASGSITLTNDGRRLVAANMLNDTISIVDATQRQTLAEVTVGSDPRSVALTPDNSRALVVNRGDGTLYVVDLAERDVIAAHPVGLLPYAVVTNNNQSAYVTLQGTDEVIHIDISSGQVLDRIAVPPSPAGLALWGDFLYVTHLWSGQFSLVYLPRGAVVQTVSTGADTSLSQSLIIDPARGLAYLPQSRSNDANTALTFDTAVFPLVNVVDLADLSLQRARRVNLDVADRPVNMPFAAALDGVRQWLYVVSAGSDTLSVIDLSTGQSRAHFRVGANPRGVLLSLDNAFAYVHNMIDGTITIIDTRAIRVTDVLPISDLRIPVDRLIGAQLFHSAADSRMSQDGWISCASCHFDGQSDGRVWRGFPGGARNTPSLYGLEETAPYTWTGEWGELAQVEQKIRGLQGGSGLSEETGGLSLDLETLVNYLHTLDSPPSPPTDDRTEQGAQVFAHLGCDGCHTGSAGTDGQRYDVGSGGEFVTPSLNWLWQSAPYLHDGRAETLYDVFILPGEHQIVGAVTPEELDALIVYLRSLPQ
jgi:YVTN family beta-propeller protein